MFKQAYLISHVLMNKCVHSLYALTPKKNQQLMRYRRKFTNISVYFTKHIFGTRMNMYVRLYNHAILHCV